MLDDVVPEAARELADKGVAQTRKVYVRSKDALEAHWRLLINLMTP